MAGKSFTSMKRAALLSLGVGLCMLFIKWYAYCITGSSAILSDAMESVVHILVVCFTTYSLWLSLKPADQNHKYGHDRITFFSAGFEGAMILIAALCIGYETTQKWLAGLQLYRLEEGGGWMLFAVAINGLLGWYLQRQGKRYHSLVLEANGKHILADCWTSLGVLASLLLTHLTGWLPLDPLIAYAVALNIAWTGLKLLRCSIRGLMDRTDPAIEAKLQTILDFQTTKHGISYHGLRHRNAGNQLFIDCHLLFPDEMPIATAHEIATQIECALQEAFPISVEIITHFEPMHTHDQAHTLLTH